MTDITRIKPGERMSQAVSHGGLVWLAGQCGIAGQSVTEQTQDALAKVEALLLEAGSDKTRILNATIWLSDIASYDDLNAVWDAWIPDGCAPARACGESRLAGEGYDVEIICVAAIA
ncbi:RidA family protein [Ruegeria jejuensis]|uniref:RidA family protein n=1 Tax=Ruegeria jejuensis TaxID=3233338 RepID=UPI00355AE712